MDKRQNHVRKERGMFPGEEGKGKNLSEKRSHLAGLAVGNELEVTIEELGKQGDGIAHAEGCTIIVPNTTVNEKVKVKVEKILTPTSVKAKRLGEIDKTKLFR